MAPEGIILCGGLGTRATHLSEGTPKALYMVQGREFIFLLLSQLAKAGVRRTILAVGHLRAPIRYTVGDEYLGMKIEYSVEEEPLGTGGALQQAQEMMTAKQVIVMNGDSIVPMLNLTDVLGHHAELGARCTMVVSTAPSADIDYGMVWYAREDIAESHELSNLLPFQIFRLLAAGEEPGFKAAWINAGVYVMDACRRPLIAKEAYPCSLERDIFPTWIGCRFYAYPTPKPLVDIGNPQQAALAQNMFYLKAETGRNLFEGEEIE